MGSISITDDIISRKILDKKLGLSTHKMYIIEREPVYSWLREIILIHAKLY